MALGFLAERSSRLLGGAIRVRSAGTWARTGSPATHEAEDATAERGVDISGHRSSHFTPAMAAGADLVLTMTAEQRAEVLHSAPEARGRTFTMKELVALLGALPPPPGGQSKEAMVARIAEADRLRATGEGPRPADEDVADPIGLSADTYRAVAWEIEELTDALVHGLAEVTEPVAARDEG
jgi:protein-tyrosine phosphatase